MTTTQPCSRHHPLIISPRTDRQVETSFVIDLVENSIHFIARRMLVNRATEKYRRRQYLFQEHFVKCPASSSVSCWRCSEICPRIKIGFLCNSISLSASDSNRQSVSTSSLSTHRITIWHDDLVTLIPGNCF